MTRLEALSTAAARFRAVGIDSSQLDATLLLTHVLGVDRVELRLRPDAELPEPAADAFEALVGRRERRVPIAQLVGHTEFWSRTFQVTADVLTPRPETEGLVQAALDLLGGVRSASPVLADIGTGSGCLAITLALELPRAVVHAVDVSQAALDVAEDNARRLGATGRVSFHLGSYCEPLRALVQPGGLDLVVSNPPYVRPSEASSCDPEVLHEPRIAVFCDEEPADVYAEIATQAAPLVRVGGQLLFELSEDPGERIRARVDGLSAWNVTDVRSDLAAIPRVLVAERV